MKTLALILFFQLTLLMGIVTDYFALLLSFGSKLVTSQVTLMAVFGNERELGFCANKDRNKTSKLVLVSLLNIMQSVLGVILVFYCDLMTLVLLIG